MILCVDISVLIQLGILNRSKKKILFLLVEVLRLICFVLSMFCPPRFSYLDGAIVSVLAPSVENRMFEFESGQTKDHNIGICC